MAYPRYTNKQINEILKSTGKEIELAGEYSSKRTKTLFRHLVCGYEWMTTFDVVGRLKGGCPECHRKSKKLSMHDIQTRLDAKNISMIGEYVNSHHKMTFKHIDCQYEWLSKPCDILNGNHGCPLCATHGFRQNLPAWTYIFERDSYIKFGITNNLEQRLKSHRRNGEIIVHHTKFYQDGKLAKEWENNIKLEFGGHYATKETCSDGYTETLPVSTLVLLEKFNQFMS